jgi:hypothetical protein
MKVQREDEKYLWFLCHNHDDKNKGNLCVNKTDCGKYPKGYGYCFACGYIMQLAPKVVDDLSSKNTVYKDFTPIDWGKVIEYFGLHEELSCKLRGLSDTWHIQPSVLTAYQIGYDGEAITCPMRNELAQPIGIQRRFPTGKKRCIEGSKLGLFISLLPKENIVVTEGFSDAAIATHVGFDGLGKPSSGYGEILVKEYLDNIGYDGKVTIVQDNDNAGEQSVKKLEAALKDYTTRVIVPDMSNDLKEYYLKNGRDKTKCLIQR